MAHLEGFEAFYAATYQRVVGRVYALLGDLAEAEDVTQDAFAKAPSTKVSRVEVNLLDFDASGRFLIYAVEGIQVSTWWLGGRAPVKVSQFAALSTDANRAYKGGNW